MTLPLLRYSVSLTVTNVNNLLYKLFGESHESSYPIRVHPGTNLAQQFPRPKW